MYEEIISTQSIYDGRIVKLAIHQVRLPDGGEGQREIIAHPGAATVVPLDDDQNVLMVKQFRLPAGQVLYELPAGTLEADEEPKTCAIRELQEETGFKPNKLEYMGGFYNAPGYSSEYIHLFWASDLVPSQLDQDADEFVELATIPFPKALEMIENGEIVDCKTIAGLLRVARKLGI